MRDKSLGRQFVAMRSDVGVNTKQLLKDDHCRAPASRRAAKCMRGTFHQENGQGFGFAYRSPQLLLEPSVLTEGALAALRACLAVASPADVRRGGHLRNELGCFPRVRHVCGMARIYFDRFSIGAFRHHALLLRID